MGGLEVGSRRISYKDISVRHGDILNSIHGTSDDPASYQWLGGGGLWPGVI